MKVSNVLHKTDVIGEPAPGEHVNLLKQKTTPDDDADDEAMTGVESWEPIPMASSPG